MTSINDSLETNSTEEWSDDMLFCDEDTHPNLRLAFISFGTIIAFVGCVANAILVYVFTINPVKRANPFQIFLAILDFLFCLLFILCFGALSFSTTFRIDWLYILLKDNSVALLILSRIVQLSIPYILIANTADRLTWIGGNGNQSKSGWMRIVVIVATSVIAIALRIPGYYVMQVIDLPHCDLFTSKALSGVDLPEFYANLYSTFDVVVQFFHLFVSFVILSLLNCVVVQKLRSSHKRARRQSSCPTVLFATKSIIEEEEKREHKRLRRAIKTTIAVISSYLACNSVNFILYSIEMFNRNLTQDENGNFNVFYVVASDLGSNLFVFSSTIRLFIFYKYNPDVKEQIRAVGILNFMFIKPEKHIEKVSDPLLGVSL